MTDRKLTEAEMITYLQLSVEIGSTARLAPEEAQTLLDIVNRKSAQIDDLKVKLDAMRGAANSYKMHYENAKSEAVKEFAERLKVEMADKKYKYVTETNYSKTVNAVIDACVGATDNLVKEITEGENEKSSN